LIEKCNQGQSKQHGTRYIWHATKMNTKFRESMVIPTIALAVTHTNRISSEANTGSKYLNVDN